MTISNRVRWLAGVTGCVTAIIGIPFFSVLSVVVSGFLIVGALEGGRFPRSGRYSIWFGAMVVSLWVIPVGLGMLRLALRGGTDPRVTAATAAVLLLVGWCDIALVIEAVRMNSTPA